MSTSLKRITTSKGRPKEKTSPQTECDQVHAAIKRWKAHDGAVLIPVVRKGTVASLEEKAKPRWWKLKKSAKSTLCITTPENLQREIESTASDGQVQELFLLISRQVDLPELKFDVPEGIDNLYIIRCTSETQSATDTPSNNKLILNGSSTFCNVRLDEWQTKRVGEHNLILGPGVVIQLSMGIPWTARDALGSISKKQREEVTKHFREMCEAKYEGTPQWDKWKGPVNKLLDVAAGSATATQVVECYANGIVVQAASKLTEFGMEGALRVSAGLLCVSGPGKIALAGVGVAAAIYFIPWDTVWGWFRAAFGALLSWLMRAWENFKSWVTNAVTDKAILVGKQGVELSVRPMLTAG
ncbi:hypothetical protein N0V82_005451 [Gnomoniopsis sp. IMI 355080]|nr:hypothetical protein N0V82_005451 [Gnomoniopsis sp. IMI 355080]